MVAGAIHLIQKGHNRHLVVTSQGKSFEMGIIIIDIQLDGLESACVLNSAC